MDPISITTGVLAMVGNSIKLLDLVHTYSSEFQRAELNVRLLSTECKTLQLALVEIDNLCANQNEASGVNSSMRLVLADCEEQFKILLEKLQPFTQLVGSARPNEMNIRARISATWKRQDIDTYRQCIQRQAELVNLLLATLQHQSIMKIRKIVEMPKFQELLKRSHDDAISLRTVHGKDKSLFYTGANSTAAPGSATGVDVESVIGGEEFSFDNEVINTPAYRRAFKSRERTIGQSASTGIPSTSTPSPSTKRRSRMGLSKLFQRAMKMKTSQGPSSPVPKAAGSPSSTNTSNTSTTAPTDTPSTTPANTSSRTATGTSSTTPTDTSSATPTKISTPTPTDTPPRTLIDTSTEKDTDTTTPATTPTDTSTAGATSSNSLVVKPINEGILESDDNILTAQAVRDAKAKVYEVLGLHREILAMKFADQSYSMIREEKIRRRRDMLEQLEFIVYGWGVESGHSNEEVGDVKRVRDLVRLLANQIY